MSNDEATIDESKIDVAPVVWPRVFKLQHPVKFTESRTITELTMRRGTIGDIKGLKVDRPLPMDTLIAIVSRLCGEPSKVIEMIDADDAGPIMEAASDFLGKCLAAGATR
jgi:hypothetical protein